MRPRLDLIDLDQPALPGHRRFVSCWLARGDAVSYIVDPGPENTAGHLVGRLRGLGVDRLDLVLLTHIHLDHAGGLATILEAFPHARVGCQERARKHLVEPGRLWEGSRQVLGALAERYGEPRPIAGDRLASPDDLEGRGIAMIPTPGHAPHHACFLHGDTLFVGEAAGTFLALRDGGWYLRPATPPRFVQEVALDSLDRLIALDPAPARLAFAHHGVVEGDTRAVLAAARAQLVRWVETVHEVRARSPRASAEDLAPIVAERLRACDPHYGRGEELPDDIARRERDFTRQTVRGMVQFVDEQAGERADENG